ncbi:MAG: OmpA family protein [Bacteroidota bacterium]|nr:OmpA family protein [Bacteroidota bacterium]
MNILFKNIVFLLILITVFSCNTNKPFTKAQYDINGGTKKVNLLNTRMAERERQYVQTDSLYNKAKLLIEQQRIALNDIQSSHKLEGLEKATGVSEEKINALYEKLKIIDPYSQKGHKKSLEILTEINDLIYSRIIPIGSLIVKNKEVKELQGDFSFKTGSSKLTETGVIEIKKHVNQLEQEILEWKSYLNNHNERIFEFDKHKLLVIIEGYADKQGSEKQNLKLSEDRAEAVRNEFVSNFNSLALKYNIIFRVSFEGKGIALPPGINDNGMQVDARRRICRVMSVVGPSKFIEE